MPFAPRSKLENLKMGLTYLSILCAFSLFQACKSQHEHQGATKAVDSQQTPLKEKVRIYDLGKGTYRVEFSNEKTKLKPGESLNLRWRVANGWSHEEVQCASMDQQQNTSITIDGDEAKFLVQIPPQDFSSCREPMQNEKGQVIGKVSLSCQKSGQLNGAKLFEGCLYRADGSFVASGKGVPVHEASKSLQLAEGLPHINDPINYGKVCAERLGPLPRDWSCLDGEIIPITRDGKEIPFGEHQFPGDTCDKPIYLGLGEQGQCVPYARLLRLYTKKDVETIVICRRYKFQEGTTYIDSELPLFQDVAIVQHNIKTGESCFFQALSGFQEDERDLPAARIPPPNEEEIPADIIEKYASLPPNQQPVQASEFWIYPEDPGTDPNQPGFQCVLCHDSDPFMHSPYVDQLNFDFRFQPSKTERFGTTRSRNNLVNPGLGEHPFAGRVDKMVPCNPGKKGNDKEDELHRSLCVSHQGSLNEASGRYSQVHQVHQRAWPNSWHIVPKSTNGTLDRTCTSCHRIGSLNTCGAWAPDSVGVAGVLGETVSSQRSEYGKKFPYSHWMPVMNPKDFFSENPECKPASDGTTATGCELDLSQWKQRYQLSADRLTNCCQLAAESDPNDPNGNEAFRKSCQAFPITKAPPTSGAIQGSVKLSAADTSIGKEGVENKTIGLNMEGESAEHLIKHILVRFALSHENPGDIKITFQSQAKKIPLFDGGRDLLHPNRPITDFAIRIDSADHPEIFANSLSTTFAPPYLLLVEDRGALDSGELKNIRIELNY